jgi:hypothetical protein
VETPAGSIWQLQSADALTGNSWQLMQTFTNATGGTESFTDNGQNSRPPPETVGARLYRVVPF